MNDPSPSPSDDRLLLSSILADPRQRRILSVLLEVGTPMTVRDLAVQVASREAGTAASAVDEDDVRELLVELRHRCLPQLRRLGWAERHAEGVVTLDGLPEEPSLPSFRDGEFEWETLAAILAYPRREHLVSVIATRDRPIGLDELAAEVAIRTEAPRPEGGLGLPAVLHHFDLPRLAEVGLIEYDPEENVVTPGTPSRRLLDWLDDGTGVPISTE